MPLERIPTVPIKRKKMPELSPEETEMKEIPEFGAYTRESPRHIDQNQDSFFVDEKTAAAGLFDGLGGHGHGETASTIAAGAALEELQNLSKNSSFERTKQAVSRALTKAGGEIVEAMEKNEEYKGMGTTATLLKIWEGKGERKAIIGNVGDSRAYLFRNGELSRITKDDSFLQLLIDMGYLPEDADQDVNIEITKMPIKGILEDYRIELMKKRITVDDIRNEITQGLGIRKTSNEEVIPNIYTVDLKKGDMILLCSDGISDNALDGEISSIMKSGGSEKELVNKAEEIELDQNNPRSKPDDKTAVVVKI